MHDALYFARLYVGEGGTTASESSILGTPAIYMNKLMMGYIKEEQEAGLLFQKIFLNDVLQQVNEVLINDKSYYQKIAQAFIREKIDITGFLVWLVENFPSSKKTIKNDPTFQNNFL
jgi:predicted glycosyltransferase